jgi:hypothetical protein
VLNDRQPTRATHGKLKRDLLRMSPMQLERISLLLHMDRFIRLARQHEELMADSKMGVASSARRAASAHPASERDISAWRKVAP